MNVISVDVEDFFNCLVLDLYGEKIDPSHRVVELTNILLDIFDELNVKSTFFILGEVANLYPKIVKMIASRQNEIGVHGWSHEKVFRLDRKTFYYSIKRAKDMLEDLTGQRIIGYRAPAMSINSKTYWVYRVLCELGFLYSSSVFNPENLNIKFVKGPKNVYYIYFTDKKITEIPLSTYNIFNLKIPVLGGGYLRHYPYILSKIILRNFERKGDPAVIYLHPYEFDTMFSKKTLISKKRSVKDNLKLEFILWLQLRNRCKSEYKIRKLLTYSSFGPIKDVYSKEIEAK